MNNFGVDITGFIGIVRPKSFHLPEWPTTKDLSFKIESGIGCLSTKGTRRTIKGRWVADNAPDTINSNDLEYVLDQEGKKVSRLPEEVSDVQPVQLDNEKTKKPRGRAAWKT